MDTTCTMPDAYVLFQVPRKKELAISKTNTLIQEVIKLTEHNACNASVIEVLYRTDAGMVKL